MGHYDTNLDKNNANYVPLTPLTFLKRAKEIYPNYEAVIYEDRKYSWDQVYKRTCLLYTSPSPRDMRRSRMPSSA